MAKYRYAVVLALCDKRGVSCGIVFFLSALPFYVAYADECPRASRLCRSGRGRAYRLAAAVWLHNKARCLRARIFGRDIRLFTKLRVAPRRRYRKLPRSARISFCRLIACYRSYFAPQAARAPRPSPQAPHLAKCRVFLADFTARDFIWCRALNLQTRRSARR